MNIYFDTCALNRLSDDDSFLRVRQEATAVLRLIDLVAEGKVRWTASLVLQDELSQNPNPVERRNALALMGFATDFLRPTQADVRRAAEFAHAGLRGLDSMHLAIAEKASADWLVTTDDRFLRFGQRGLQSASVEVVNPVDLVQRRFPWLLPHKS